MAGQTSVRPHDGVLFGHENEWSAEMHARRAKENKPDMKGQLLHDSIYMKYLEQADAGAGRRGEWRGIG